MNDTDPLPGGAGRARVVVMLAGVLAFGASLAVRAADPPDITTYSTVNDGQSGLVVEDVDVGLRGLLKVGEWTRLRVTLRSSAARRVVIIVSAPDADDNLAEISSPAFDLPAETSRQFETCFRTARQTGDLHLRINDQEGKSLYSRRLRPGIEPGADFRPGLRLDATLWVALRNLPEMGDSPSEPRVVVVGSPAELPVDPRSYQSVNALFFQTARESEGPGNLEQLPAEQNAALREWVRAGGHLLISIGSDAGRWANSPLAEWLPVEISGTTTVRQLTNLESYAGRTVPLTFRDPVVEAKIAPLPPKNTIMSESGGPLVASVPFGIGRVTVIGLDIDRPPLSTWPALPTVLKKLAGAVERPARQQVRGSNRQLSHVGVSDLATQWQSTVEDFRDVRRPSYWWVMGLILVYVAVIGPLDYVVVHRWLRRPELTWVTFPLLAGVAVGAAAWGATRVNGRELIVNQLDLVDVDASEGTALARTWTALYSPESRRYSVAIEPRRSAAWGNSDSLPANVQLTWSAPPETVVGGLYRSGSAGLASSRYRQSSAGGAIEEFPILQWSTRTLQGQWQPAVRSGLIESKLESPGPARVLGTFMHHFDGPLEDCLLVYGGWAIRPMGLAGRDSAGVIPPHVVWKTDDANRYVQRNLRALMTGLRQTRRTSANYREEVESSTEAYDPLSHEPGTLVTMCTFHDEAGGTEYTGLTHRALRELDLTELMRLGRGILIGRMRAPTARVLVDGVEREPADRATFVRIIVPVRQIDASPAKHIPKAEKTPD